MMLTSRHAQENTVTRLIGKRRAKVAGTTSCFDRILFRGHLPLGQAQAMESSTSRQGLRIKTYMAADPPRQHGTVKKETMMAIDLTIHYDEYLKLLMNKKA